MHTLISCLRCKGFLYDSALSVVYWLYPELGGRVMKKPVVIVCLISCCMSFLLAVSPSEVSSYLTANHVELSFGDDGLSDFSSLNCGDYQVFLAGESHVYQKSYAMKKEMLRYLHQNAGVRYLLIEAGFCATLMLEEFLRSGDDAILKAYMAELKGSFGYVQENFDFWKWMHEYNQGFSEVERIHVVGLDVDFQKEIALAGLNTLYDDQKRVPLRLQDAVDSLKTNVWPHAYHQLRNTMERYPNTCKSYFGESYSVLEQGLRTLKATIEYESQDISQIKMDSHQIRDEVMQRNFQFILDRHPDEKFFGQFGSEHIYQRSCETSYLTKNYLRFGTILQTDVLPIHKKVCSILYMYQTPEMYSPDAEYLSHRPFENYQGQDILFDLTAVDSPFAKEELLLNGNGTGGVTTDYFQKLVLLSDSPYTRPYRPYQ